MMIIEVAFTFWGNSRNMRFAVVADTLPTAEWLIKDHLDEKFMQGSLDNISYKLIQRVPTLVYELAD